MGFSSKPLNNMPHSLADCKRIWTTRNENKGSRKLADNTELVKRSNDLFQVELYGHSIVHFYEGYTRLYTCGYDTSPMTISRLNSFTSAYIYRDSSVKCEDKLRIGRYPFIEGIRVLPNGQVHPEDKRPDVVVSATKEAISAYIKLFNWIKKQLRARFALGEFKDNDARLLVLEIGDVHALFIAKDGFIPHEMALKLLSPFWDDPFDDCLNRAREWYRDDFYKMVNGYERTVFQNA